MALVNTHRVGKEVCSGISSLWKIQVPGSFPNRWHRTSQKSYAGIHIFKLPKWFWNTLEMRTNVLLGKFNHHKFVSLDYTNIKILFLLGIPVFHPWFFPKRKLIYVFCICSWLLPVWNALPAPYCLFKSSSLLKLGSSFTFLLLTQADSININKLQNMWFSLLSYIIIATIIYVYLTSQWDHKPYVSSGSVHMALLVPLCYIRPGLPKDSRMNESTICIFITK